MIFIEKSRRCGCDSFVACFCTGLKTEMDLSMIRIYGKLPEHILVAALWVSS
jgi:hypothetical protein